MSRSSSGQATIEYVGLLALLAALLAAALGVAVVGAPGVVNAVVGQVRHALCLVGGGECLRLEPRACVLRSDTARDGIAVSIGVVRLDHEHVVVREVHSDGTEVLTRLRQIGVGGGASSPTSAEVRFGATRVGLGGDLSWQVLGFGGRGRVWHAASKEEADRIVAALEGDGADPEPHEVFVEGGLAASGHLDSVLGVTGSSSSSSSSSAGRSSAGDGAGREPSGEGRRSGRVLVPDAGAGVQAELALGWRDDRRTGERTYVLRLDQRARLVLESAIGTVRGAQAAGGLAEVVVGRDGRPRELLVRGTVMLEGAASSPALDAVGLGGLRGARRVELTSRVDLRDPAVRASFSSWWADPLDRRAQEGLRRALADRAHVEARAYATSTDEDRHGAGARWVVEVGGEVREGEERERLVGAVDRPPGGLWEPRLDCRAA
jgi:hypothetical protein